jgi:predicted lipoprotein with Yx(FWY)xxD motif
MSTSHEAKAASSESSSTGSWLAAMARFKSNADAAPDADDLDRPRVRSCGQMNLEVHMTYRITLLGALVLSAIVAATAASFAFAGGAAKGTKVDLSSSEYGKILVDSKGITLYDFALDKKGASVCYGACAALWPPLLTTGKPVAGPGVKASLLGTTKRKDGKLEVTYNRHPLYYFVTDRKRGQTTGQAVNQFGAPWWVISAAGKEIHRG